MSKVKSAISSSKSEIVARISMTIMSGSASPSPPLGPALGQKGVNIMKFCKQFNDSTNLMKKNIPIPTEIDVYGDKNFKFIIKVPPVSYFLKKALGVNKLSSDAKIIIGELTLKHVYEISMAKLKCKTLQHIPLKSFCKSVIGMARQSGIRIVSGKTSK